MEKTTIELIKITPSEGMMLTNGSVCSDEVYIGANDSIDNWREITMEEYEKIMGTVGDDTQGSLPEGAGAVGV